MFYDWTANTPIDQAKAVLRRMTDAVNTWLGTTGADVLDADTARDAAITELILSGPTVVPTTKSAFSENAYIKTDSGVKDLLAAAAASRMVHIVVTVTAVFANGDGAQPTLTIGEESGSASKFAAASKFTSAALGATFAFAGLLTTGKKLQATLVAGTGSTETGAYTIDVLAAG